MDSYLATTACAFEHRIAVSLYNGVYDGYDGDSAHPLWCRHKILYITNQSYNCFKYSY
jgi:hypothetical protein